MPGATPRKLRIREIDLHKPGTRAYHDVRARLMAEGKEPPTPVRDPEEGFLPIYTSHEMMHIPPPKWLIRFLVEEEGLGVVVGEKKSGKTAWLMTMLWNWVLGKDWGFDPDFAFETPVEERRVLYMMLEGSASYGQRLRAFADANEVDVYDDRLLNFRGLRSSMNLNDGESIKLLNASIKDWVPKIVVVDTLSRATPGGEENSAKDMSQLINLFDQMRDVHGIATIVCHHTGWANTSRMRGSTALPGAMSSEVLIKRDKTKGSRTVVIGDQRNIDDAPNEYPMQFTPVGESFYVQRMKTSVMRDAGPSIEGMKLDEAMAVTGKSKPTVYRMAKQQGLTATAGVFLAPVAEDPDAI